jgi:two-component system invasion response regulator UvrY
VLVLSMHAEEQYAIRCLRAGASGYIQKDSSPEELLEAMRRVAMGRMYISEGVAEQLATEVAQGSSDHHPHERLSTREFEVFRLIGTGKSATEIADALHLSVKTVSTYRTRILLKTGFRTNADIITYVVRSGLV